MNRKKWLKIGLLSATVAGAIVLNQSTASASIFSNGNDVKSILKSSNMFDSDWSKAIDNEQLNASAFATATAGQSSPSSKPQWELNNSTGTNQDANNVDVYPNSKTDKNLNVTNDHIWTTTRYRSTSQILTNYKLSISQAINTVETGDTSINKVRVYRMKNSDYNAITKSDSTSIPVSAMEDITDKDWVSVYSGKNVANKGYEKTSEFNDLSQWQVSRQVVVNLNLKNSPDYKDYWNSHKYADVKSQDYKSMKAPTDDYIYFVQTEQTLTSDKLSDDNTTTIPDTTLDTLLGGTNSKSVHKTADDQYDISAGTFKFNNVQSTAPFSDYRDWSNTVFANYMGTTESYRSRQKYVGAEPQLDKYQRRLNISTSMHVLNATPMINNLTPLLGYTSVIDDTYGIQNKESNEVSIRSANVGQGSTESELFDGTKLTDTQAIDQNFSYVLKAYVPAIYKDKLLKDPQEAIKEAKVTMTTFKPNNVVISNSAEKAIDVQLDKAVFYRIDPKTGKATTDMSNLNTDDAIYVYIPAKMNDVSSSNYADMMSYYRAMQDTITHSFSISQLNYHSQQTKINMLKIPVMTSYYKYGTAPDHKATGYTGDSQYVTNPDDVKPETSDVYAGLKTSLIDNSAKKLDGWTYANQSSGFADDRISTAPDASYENWFSYKRVYTTRIQKIAQYPLYKLNDKATISAKNPLVGSVDFITATDSDAWNGYNVEDDPDITISKSRYGGTNKKRIISSVAKLQSHNSNFVSATSKNNETVADTFSSLKAVSSEVHDGVSSTYTATRNYITSDKSVSENGGISFSLVKKNKPTVSEIDYTQKPWVDFEASDKTFAVVSPITDTSSDSTKKYAYSDNSLHTISNPAERILLYNKDGSVKETKTLDEKHEVQLTSPANASANGGDTIAVDATTKVTSYGKSSIERLNHGYTALDLTLHTSGFAGGLDDGAEDSYVGFATNTLLTTNNSKDKNPYGTIYTLKVTDDTTNIDKTWLTNPTISGLNVSDEKLLSLVNSDTRDSDQMLDTSGKIASIGDNSSDVKTSDIIPTLQSNSMETSRTGVDDSKNNSIDRVIYDGTDKITGSVSLSQATTPVSTREQYTYVGHHTFNRSVVDKGQNPTQTFGNYVSAKSNQRNTSGKLLTPAMYIPSKPVDVNITIGAQENENYFLTSPKITLSTRVTFNSTRFPAVNDTALHKSDASFTIEPTNSNRINKLDQYKPYRAFYNSK